MDDLVARNRKLKDPRVVVVLSVVTVINLLFVCLFFKELKLSTFDPALATASGFSASLMHYALMTLVAITAVASFESVGNILVVAMFIVPPATAYLLTNRLGLMVFLACLIGAVGAVVGHVGAVEIPTWFGYRSTTTAGMMSVAVGMFFLLRPGLFASTGSVAALGASTVAALVDSDRRCVDAALSIGRIRRRGRSVEYVGVLIQRRTKRRRLGGRNPPDEPISSQFGHSDSAMASTRGPRCGRTRAGHPKTQRERPPTIDRLPRLTEIGRREAQTIIRSHRLWEQYLVTKVAVEGERLHQTAHKLEHFTDRDLQDRLHDQTDSPSIDPHGRRIPEAEN